MRMLIAALIAILILVAQPIRAHAEAAPVVERAIAVWHEYQSALKAGDDQRARAYWTESARRYPAVDWQAWPRGIIRYAQTDSLAVSEAQDIGAHVRLSISSPRQKFTYYVQSEPEALLANPVEVLTRDWQSKRTEHYILRYPSSSAPLDHQIRDLDQFYRTTTDRLWPDLPGEPEPPIEYYLCESVTQVGELFGADWAVGRAHIENRVVAATLWTGFHEVVHVLIGGTCRNQPTALLLEGAACWFGGAGMVTAEAQLDWAKTLIEQGRAMPLADLVDGNRFWSADDMNDPYSLAASFTGYLIDRYGIEQYKTLYGYRDASKELKTELESLSGLRIEDIDEQWKGWVLRQDVPAIRLGEPGPATEIFSMQDPAHDDTGSGGFQYPLAQKYRPGIFDLTGFRVLSGEGMVHFELAYRNLVEWDESAEWGFGGTYTTICVDCGRQGDPSLDKRRDSPGVWRTIAAADGHCDLKINVSDRGVQLWRDGQIRAALLHAPAGERLGDAAANRIRFSIPCDEPEAARRAWRYAVAVGGREGGDGTFRQGNGGFLDVVNTASENVGGGGDPQGARFYDILLDGSINQGAVLGAPTVLVPMVGGN